MARSQNSAPAGAPDGGGGPHAGNDPSSPSRTGAPGPARPPIKLLYVTSIPLTQWIFLVGQNRFMQERGFEVHAVASPGPLLDALARRDGVLIHPVSIPRRFAPLRDLAALGRLTALFRQIQPDIVQAGTPKASLLGALAAFLARVPARIFHWHGSITEGVRGIRRAIFGLVERVTAALCHDVLCVSPSLLSYARSRRLLPADRGTVLLQGMCNGIDITRFDPTRPGIVPASEALARSMGLPAEPIVIGFVGRLTRRKGIEDLASAWSVLREECAGAFLLLVGDWEEEDPVSPSVRAALERDPRVRIPGPVEDVVPYYRLMSVLVLPSLREGFPTAPMEAAAMGVPTVAYRVTGSTDAVLDGATGRLVPVGEIREFASAIRAYVLDPGTRERHGAAARQRVLEDFRQEEIWEATYRHYLGLLGRRGLPLPFHEEGSPAGRQIEPPPGPQGGPAGGRPDRDGTGEP